MKSVVVVDLHIKLQLQATLYSKTIELIFFWRSIPESLNIIFIKLCYFTT